MPKASSILDHIMPMIMGERSTGKKTAFLRNFVPGILVSMISAPIKPNILRVRVVSPTKINVFINDFKKTLSLKTFKKLLNPINLISDKSKPVHCVNVSMIVNRTGIDTKKIKNNIDGKEKRKPIFCNFFDSMSISLMVID